MKKRVFPRILWFLFVYCVVLLLMVVAQFARRGNFTQKIGEMTVSGRYLLSDDATGEESRETGKRFLDGGAAVFFGGLEFRLNYQPDADSGFTLIDSEGARRPVYPESVFFLEDEAVFTLPGGVELSFAGYVSGGQQEEEKPEFRISGNFPPDVYALDIPFRPLRSSVIRDSAADVPDILYNGVRYRFSRNLQGLANGRLVLLSSAPSVSYGAVADKKEFNPGDFIIQQAQTQQAFSGALSAWVTHNFEWWTRNMSHSSDEDLVIAWCAEGVRRGNYRSAASAVPAQFSTDPHRTWESGVFQFDRRIGVWERAVRAAAAFENENESRVSRLLSARDIALFENERLIEFLAVRGNNQMIDALLAFASNIDPAALTIETSAGVLENFAGLNQWRPETENPFAPLAEQVCRLISEDLHEASNGVFVFSNGHADTAFNSRLGMALNEWGEITGNDDWAGLGRSLVLSVLSLDDENGSIPAAFGGASHGRVSTARLYRLLRLGEYLPLARATGANGVWAWTAASSVTVSQNDRQMDITVEFPAGLTHYVMLRNVRPFAQLQINETNWRSARDFESYYDSSGWYYFTNERTLILKIRQRTNTELVRILFTVPTPPPAPRPPPPPPPPEERAEE